VPLDDKRKVQERLDMWDSLTEQDPKMKQIRAQSKAEGKAEGELKASQRMVLALIDVRFPSLVELAKRHVKQVKDPETLTQLAKQIAIAPDEDTARSILVSYAARYFNQICLQNREKVPSRFFLFVLISVSPLCLLKHPDSLTCGTIAWNLFLVQTMLHRH
jgi:hypothetical protein